MTIDITKKKICADNPAFYPSSDFSFSLCQPLRASQRAPCQPVLLAYPKRSKRSAEELSYSKTRGLTSEDLPLITVCLLGQSQEEVPRQRLPEILWWHLFKGGKGTARKMARCQANITHTFANRNLHTVNRRFRMPSMFSAMASPQGRDPKQRWHHAKRKLGGIHKRHQRLYKTVLNADTK